MFYAKSNVSQKLDIYSSLLQRAIDEGDKSNYRLFFIDAFATAHDLATEEKTFVEVEKNIYDIVYILVKSNPGYFKSLDKSNIDDKVFADVKVFFGSLRQANTLVLNG